MFKKIKLKKRLVWSFVLVGLLPIVVIISIMHHVVYSSLLKVSFDNLELIRDIKKDQIQEYLNHRYSELMIIANDPEMHEAAHEMEKMYDNTQDPTQRHKLIDEAFSPMLSELEETMYIHQWVDFYIFNSKGDLIFSVDDHENLGKNIKDINIRRMRQAFDEVSRNPNKSIWLSDFGPYGSEKGISAFMMIRVDEADGYFGLRISGSGISRIMTSHLSQEESRTFYLVGAEAVKFASKGGDIGVDNDGGLPKQFAEALLSSEATDLALDGKSGTMITTQSDGGKVLVAYEPLDTYGLNWAIIVEIPIAEALAEKTFSWDFMIFLMSMGCLVGIVILALIIANSIIKPINAAVEVMHALSNGDLTQTVVADTEDEIGVLVHSINSTNENLRKILSHINSNSRELHNASEDLSKLSDKITENSHVMNQQAVVIASASEQMQASVNIMENSSGEISQSSSNVASAIEEMSTSITQVSKNCEQGSNIATQANEKAKSAQEVMNQLAASVSEISNAAEIIGDIAEQTNLLALNANIEAASAGEAGKGFSVVANEVKELAKKSAEAARDISNRIQKMLNDAEVTIKSFDEISGIIAEVCEITNHTALNVKEQSVTTNEIVRNMSGVSKATNELAATISQFAMGSNQITENINRIRSATERSIQEVQQGNLSAQTLRGMSEELASMMDQFKLN